jgi:DNA-binding response OmpR family regulator
MSGEETTRQGASILLVEDNEILRELILRNLQVRGHVVSIADCAEAALAQLQAHLGGFDLVILDINLPDRTGWDILRIAQHEGYLTLQQHNERHPTLPVVVLSAVRVSPNRLAEFHPLAYLPKPFPMDALLRLVSEVAEQRRTRTAKKTALEAVNDQIL